MKLKWLLKQLLPLKYSSTYVNDEGKQVNVKWRMWFNKSFNIKNSR